MFQAQGEGDLPDSLKLPDPPVCLAGDFLSIAGDALDLTITGTGLTVGITMPLLITGQVQAEVSTRQAAAGAGGVWKKINTS